MAVEAISPEGACNIDLEVPLMSMQWPLVAEMIDLCVVVRMLPLLYAYAFLL
jgi:hypothetical protein